MARPKYVHLDPAAIADDGGIAGLTLSRVGKGPYTIEVRVYGCLTHEGQEYAWDKVVKVPIHPLEPPNESPTGRPRA